MHAKYKNFILIRPSLAVLLILFVAISSGCERRNTASNKPSGQSNDQKIDARKILQTVMQRYQSANSYQDKGVLYLSYLLNGQRVDEPKRWSTVFRNDGQFAMDVFNAKIHADQKILGCQIFDIETANFDNQTLLIPANRSTTANTSVPLNALLRDGIARHFVLGFSEMPLDTSRAATGPWLLPPAASLLTGQTANPWIQSPSQVQRLADQSVDRRECFVIRSQHEKLTADIWIDKQTMAIRQMSLPIKLLADEVLVADEVSEIVLQAKFHDAVFDADLPVDLFKFQPRPESVFVRKLISLPEPLPSEKIADTAPPFSLKAPDGTTVRRRNFDQKTTLLVWLSGQHSINTAKQLTKILDPRNDQTLAAIVYSDSDTQQPGSGRPTPSKAIDQLGRDLKIPVFYDREHSVSSTLKIKAIPAAVVMDGNAKIQYVQTMAGDDWQTKLAAAINRVNAGEDVCDEMRESYAVYLDTYHQQIDAVRADSLVPGWLKKQLSPRVKFASQPLNRRWEIRPQRIWSNQDFKRPGNITAIRSNRSTHRFAIYDGLQTIGLVDGGGELIGKRKVADLQDDESITQLRSLSNGEQTFLTAFSVLGRRYFLLRSDLSSIRSVASSDQSDNSIADVQWSPSGQLLIAWSGGGVTAESNQSHPTRRSLSGGSFDQLAVANQTIAGIEKGNIVSVAGDHRSTSDGIQFSHVYASGQQFVGLGQDASGRWSAIGMDDRLNQVWAIETGPHLHENFLQPVSSAAMSSGERVCVIIDSQQMVHLVTGTGQWLGEFQANDEVLGACVENINDQLYLLLSFPRKIDCWNLNIESTRHAAN